MAWTQLVRSYVDWNYSKSTCLFLLPATHIPQTVAGSLLDYFNFRFLLHSEILWPKYETHVYGDQLFFGLCPIIWYAWVVVKAWRGCGDNMVYIGVYIKEWWCPKGGEIAIYRPMCGQCIARDSCGPRKLGTTTSAISGSTTSYLVFFRLRIMRMCKRWCLKSHQEDMRICFSGCSVSRIEP